MNSQCLTNASQFLRRVNWANNWVPSHSNKRSTCISTKDYAKIFHISYIHNLSPFHQKWCPYIQHLILVFTLHHPSLLQANFRQVQIKLLVFRPTTQPLHVADCALSYFLAHFLLSSRVIIWWSSLVLTIHVHISRILYNEHKHNAPYNDHLYIFILIWESRVLLTQIIIAHEFHNIFMHVTTHKATHLRYTLQSSSQNMLMKRPTLHFITQ